MSRYDDADRAAIRMLERLVEDGGIEFVSSRGVSALASGLANLLLRVADRPDRGAEIGAWLMDAVEVRELYADDEQLESIFVELWDPLRERDSSTTLEARRADLEALLLAEPDNLDHRLVYGDWLQAHRDPFGELITRQIAADEHSALARAAATSPSSLSPRSVNYLSDYAEALFGPLAEYLDVVVQLDWRAGFIERARVGKSMDDPESYQGAILLRWLLEHRAAMLLRELELHSFEHHRHSDQFREMLAVLLEQPRPLLRRLIVGERRDLRQDRSEYPMHDAGRLAQLDVLLPRLEILELHVRDVIVEQLCHPTLRRLVWAATIGARQAAAFARFELPRLEDLALQSTYADERLGPILAELELPALRAFAMSATTEDLGWLTRACWREQLECLDLSDGDLDDLDARALARLDWPRLRRLDLSNNRLGTGGRAIVERLCPEVVTDSQRRAGDSDYDDDGEEDDDDDEYYDDVME